MIPCKDCITLAICKSNVKTNRGNLYSNIIPKCKLLRDYMHVVEYYHSWFRFNPTYEKRVVETERFFKLRLLPKGE